MKKDDIFFTENKKRNLNSCKKFFCGCMNKEWKLENILSSAWHVNTMAVIGKRNCNNA